MPTVTVTSPVSVLVDGVPYGAPADVIANNPALASLVQVALVAYVDGLTAKHAQALDAQANAHADHVQAITDASAAELSKVAASKDAERDAILARFDALGEKHGAALAELAATKTDRDQHKGRADTAEASFAELTAAKAKIDGDLASVTAERDAAQARVAELEALYLPQYDENGVPKQVSNYQLRSALVDIGIFPEDITTRLSAMDEKVARAKALSAWEYANNFERSHPLISALAVQLGLSEEQVNDLFKAAVFIK